MCLFMPSVRPRGHTHRRSASVSHCTAASSPTPSVHTASVRGKECALHALCCTQCWTWSRSERWEGMDVHTMLLFFSFLFFSFDFFGIRWDYLVIKCIVKFLLVKIESNKECVVYLFICFCYLVLLFDNLRLLRLLSWKNEKENDRLTRRLKIFLINIRVSTFLRLQMSMNTNWCSNHKKVKRKN